MQTSELAGLFEDFYSKFVLRDLFGKITPGGIFIFTVVSSHATIDGAISKAAALSFWAWVFLLGVAWLMGFAIQSVGELGLGGERKLFRYHPRGAFSNHLEAARDIVDLGRSEEFQKHKILYERINVIKEACGNGYVSLLAASIWIGLDLARDHWSKFKVDEFANYWPECLLMAAVIYYLARAHFTHVDRQHAIRQRIKELSKNNSGGRNAGADVQTGDSDA